MAAAGFFDAVPAGLHGPSGPLDRAAIRAANRGSDIFALAPDPASAVGCTTRRDNDRNRSSIFGEPPAAVAVHGRRSGGRRHAAAEFDDGGDVRLGYGSGGGRGGAAQIVPARWDSAAADLGFGAADAVDAGCFSPDDGRRGRWGSS
ncbi:hypothetical protein HK405_014180 [Cladochytrium tenue]|nr:hypothetical protein HK405_014180 [Cladochytrium tenue]